MVEAITYDFVSGTAKEASTCLGCFYRDCDIPLCILPGRAYVVSPCCICPVISITSDLICLLAYFKYGSQRFLLCKATLPLCTGPVS